MFRFTLVAALAILSASVVHCGYAYPGVPAYAPALTGYVSSLPGYVSSLPALPRYAPAPVILPAPAATPLVVPQNADASADALNDIVGARASAAKIGALNQHALDRYGYETGRPLLVTPFGVLTNLYSASLPQGSLVGKVGPVFRKSPYGNIQYISGSSIGVAVV